MPPTSEPFSCKFGELEAILADLNDIPSPQRAAFQARLKNYHRLKFPKGFGNARAGRAVMYGIGDLVQMAVIVEMTQLGLTPERAIKVYESDEYPVLMAVSHAANALVGRNPDYTFHPEQGLHEERENPASMFLYFDPAALSPETESEDEDWASATFFYAGEAVVRENLAEWTTRRTRRLSLINVTALLWEMGGWIEDEKRDGFFEQIQGWADFLLYREDFEMEEWLLGPVRRMMMDQAATPIHPFHPQEGSGEWVALRELIEDAGLFDEAGQPVMMPALGEVPSMPLFELPEQELNEFGGPSREGPPDMIINLPGQRQLLVDAKTSPLVDTPDVAIRMRVEELAQEPYRKLICPPDDSPPPPRQVYTDKNKFVVLYLPGKQFFTDAFREDKRLWEWAFEKNVIIATPASMRAVLREAQQAWKAADEWERADVGAKAWTLTEVVLEDANRREEEARQRGMDMAEAERREREATGMSGLDLLEAKIAKEQNDGDRS